MKFCPVILALIITVTTFSACGGGDADEKPIILQPDPIPVEYEGLSMDELNERSSGLSYGDILGDKEKGIYKSDTDPAITESILKHKGKLVYFEGMVEEIYASSQEGVYTFWMCTSGWDSLRQDGIAVAECGDPLFVRYSLDLGPELAKGGMINLAATIFGSRTKKSRGMQITWQASVSTSVLYTTPEVSTIKLELIDE